jgi:Xaa-Pro dipeptidase
MLSKKIERVQSLLQRQGADALFVGNFGHQVSDDLLYWLLLTKLEYGYMIIPASGKPTLHAISFEVEMLRHKRDEINIVPIIKKTPAFPSELKSILYRPSALPTSMFEELQKTNVNLKKLEDDHTLWVQKLPKEISRMEQAAKITDELFADLVKNWDEFYTEADAANFLLKEMSTRGLDPSFPPIVASGPHAANPHHHAAYKKLQTGFCVIDMGVRFKGYCSDMTRTIFIGEPTEEDRHLYNKLLDAQQKTASEVKVGKKIAYLSLSCRDMLGEELSKEFIHSLGHGVGSQVHEWPSVSKKSTAILIENMIITIEPGVYRQGEYGIRIEDDVLVTKEGPRVLNATSKELITVSIRS